MGCLQENMKNQNQNLDTELTKSQKLTQKEPLINIYICNSVLINF